MSRMLGICGAVMIVSLTFATLLYAGWHYREVAVKQHTYERGQATMADLEHTEGGRLFRTNQPRHWRHIMFKR